MKVRACIFNLGTIVDRYSLFPIVSLKNTFKLISKWSSIATWIAIMQNFVMIWMVYKMVFNY